MIVHIAPLARLQLSELVLWWDENRPSARGRVVREFEAALDLLEVLAFAGRIYSKAPQYRTLQLKGTPYALFYRVDEDAEAIWVDGVWSTMRGEGPPLR
ncbi:type II toxin-antitoxin system RelE/ParE family toxin [Myxococcota bacterium]|nr:type II toxin-antitoxin system RelE/ParE family toxin [Myxococcota bacterium]